MAKKLIYWVIPLVILLLSNSFVSAQKTVNNQKNVEIRQPSGDLGNGYYKNPVIMAGDIADLSVVRDGHDYYLMHGYSCAPGYIIWHSRDLVNWDPVKKLFQRGGGWQDLAHFGDQFCLYGGGKGGINIRFAPHPLGPWSEPITLGGDTFDEAHMYGPNGKNYVIGGGIAGKLYELASDSKSIVSTKPLNYQGWEYPKSWVTECGCLEGWNTVYKDGYYYLLAAQGGTSGPPTSHMCVSARSKNPDGPWENSPYNPIIHTYSANEPFWSKGQGLLIDTPEGEWYIMYHGYLKDERNLGRQVFLEPVEWTKDGWFRIPEGQTADQMLPKPKGGEVVPHGFRLTDDFKGPDLDVKWGFPASSAEGRYRFVYNGIALKAFGANLKEGVPMVMPVTHRAYEIVAEMTVPAGAEGGLTIYYSKLGYCGISLKDGEVKGFALLATGREKEKYQSDHIFLKMRYLDNNASEYFSKDGKEWKKIDMVADISMYHRNALGDSQSIRPGIFACGQGEVIVHNFKLTGLY